MNRFSALLLAALPVMSALAQDATKVIRESAPLSAADSTGKIWTRGATLLSLIHIS